MRRDDPSPISSPAKGGEPDSTLALPSFAGKGDGGLGPTALTLDLPAAPGYSRAVEEAIAALLAQVAGVIDRDTLQHDIYLAVHEVCLNIVEHAYRDTTGRVSMTLRLEDDPRHLVIETEDTGDSFDPVLVPEPDLVQGQERGYGLYLARQLMDEVTYSSAPGHNRWRLVKHLL